MPGALGSGDLGEGNGGAGITASHAVDLVFGDGGSEEVAVLAGDGQGNFTVVGSSSSALGEGGGSSSTGRVVDLTLADVNGDGNVDVVTALSSGELSTLLGDGALGLAAGPRGILAAVPLRLEIAELTADARPDAVVATESGLELLRNTGSGGFEHLGLVDAERLVSDVAIGRAGIVAALPDADQVKVYRLAAETVEGVATIDVDDPLAVAAADFTGDGVEDVAVASGAGFVAVYPGRAEGGFAASVMPRVSGVMIGRLWRADLNGDGLADLIGLDRANPALPLLYGYGDGTFDLQAGPAGSQPAVGVAVADLNGDRFPDLVLSGEEITIGIAETGGPPIVPGDANGDGELTAADVDQLVSEIFDGDGEEALSCGAPPILSAAGADANGDGVIGAADLTPGVSSARAGRGGQ
jgi:hypothetical protein